MTKEIELKVEGLCDDYIHEKWGTFLTLKEYGEVGTDFNAGAKAMYSLLTTSGDVQERAKELTGIEKEVKASMLMMPPDDEYKKGWNGAMQKVLSIIKNYKDGKGLFQ